MKNNIFSLKRLCKLVKTDLSTAWIWYAIFVGIIVIYNVITYSNLIHGHHYNQLYESHLFVAWIALVIAGQAFCDISGKGRRINYLTLPATNAEKLASRLLVYMIFPIGIYIISCFYNSEYIFMKSLNIGDITAQGRYVVTDNFINEISNFYTFEKIRRLSFAYCAIAIAPIMALGSLIFKGFAFGKTATIFLVANIASGIFADKSAIINMTFQYPDQFAISLKKYSPFWHYPISELEFTYHNVVLAITLAVVSTILITVLFNRKSIAGYTKSENYGF